ncbi:MAG: thiol-disulfide isomerase, partial [Bryobacteraceae bacterium]
DRSMPPWHADAETSRRIRNSRALTKTEIETLVKWVDNGAVEGAPIETAAAAPIEPSGWRLGKPDLIIRVPGYKVPAEGTIQYTFLVTPSNFTEDHWISAAEWKIDQRAVVHHMNAFVRPSGSSYLKSAPLNQLYVASKDQRLARRDDEKEVDRRELLIGYEPGYRAAPWGEGRAKLIRKGADIVFEIHYTANGSAREDHSELGIYFAKEPPRERVLSLSPADSKLAIPPGDPNYASSAKATFTQDVKLISMQPHMHLRGKDFDIRATYADGRTDELLRVPRYDFRWQTTYFLADPINLSRGSSMDFLAHFDNSANNSFNPDPSKTIHWGDQSWEEMNIGFIEVAFPADADPNVAILSDTSKPAPTASIGR